MHTCVISSLFLCLTSIFVTFFFSRRQLLPAKTDRATVRLAVINDFAFQHASAIRPFVGSFSYMRGNQRMDRSLWHVLAYSIIFSYRTSGVQFLRKQLWFQPFIQLLKAVQWVEARAWVLLTPNFGVEWRHYQVVQFRILVHFQDDDDKLRATTHIAKRYVSAWLIRILLKSNVGSVVVNKVLSILS